jgi:hypothetical protein
MGYNAGADRRDYTVLLSSSYTLTQLVSRSRMPAAFALETLGAGHSVPGGRPI